MATGLRPDLIVRQVFRTASPIVPASTMPAVLVGVHRQLAYRVDAGSFVGGQDNGDYSFPGLSEGAAIEPASNADTLLRPKVHISTDYGVADITDDATFADLDNSGSAPTFTISDSPEASFTIASGDTGSYSNATDLFTDPNADFIEDRVGVGDSIELGGAPAFTVVALNSDDELEVTKTNRGPSDAAVTISAVSGTGVRTLTYTGDLANAYDGFVGRVRVGDTVTLNGWSNLATSGSLYYGATVDGVRTLTLASGDFEDVFAGDVISLYVIRDGVGSYVPYFIVTKDSTASATTLAVINIASDITAASSITVDEALAYSISSPDSQEEITDGEFTAQAVDETRTFTTAASLTASPASYILTYAAKTVGAQLTFASTTQITRSAGSFVTDGYIAGQRILIVDSTDTSNLGVVAVLDTVSALAMTVTTAVLSTQAAGTTTIYGLPVVGLFKITTTGGECVDMYPGTLAPSAYGSGLVATVLDMSENVSAVVPDFPTVSAVTPGSDNRGLIWPSTLAAAGLAVGDMVFSEDGDLLFSVTDLDVEVTGLVASGLSNATAVVTLTTGTTADLVVGMTLTKTAGVGVFEVGATIVSIESSTQFTASDVHDTSGTITFTAATPDTVVVVQNHDDAPIVIADDDTVTGALVIRDQDEAVYRVLRVNSSTQLQMKASSTATTIPDNVDIIRGAITEITVPDLLSDETYTIEKTVTGADLLGTVLVTYAARRVDHLGELIEVTQGTVTDLLGPAVPHNPLGFAGLNAVNNTSVPIFCVQVADDTESGWAAALNTIKTSQVYAVAPLTNDEERLAEFRSHVINQSLPENKRERILFQSHLFSTQTTRWTMDSLESATLIKTTSTQTVTLTTAEGVVGLGVRAGDVIEGTFYGYLVGQGFVNGTLAARISNVSEIGGDTTLTLVPLADSVLADTLAGGVDMVTLVIKSKVLTTNQYRDAIAAYPATIQERRVRNIYPDRTLVTFDDETNPNDTSVGLYGGGEISDYEVGNWLAAATLAAMRSGLLVSTPLTKRGFSGIQRLINPFGTSVADLDTILDGGNMLLSQTGGDGSNCSAVRAVTTDTTDLNHTDDAITVQLDNVCRKLRRQMLPLMGTMIIDEGFDDVASATIAAVRDDCIRNKEIRALTLVSFEEDPIRADTFTATMNGLPYQAANHGDITIYI